MAHFFRLVNPAWASAWGYNARAIPEFSSSYTQNAIFLAIQDNQSLVVGGLSLGFLIISLGIHEAAHAFAAWRCGDSTAKDMGRMTLDPIPHIDPFMTILMPAVMYLTTGLMFGGAKPVPVVYERLNSPLRDMSIVAVAGPLSNFLLAILFMTIWKVLVYVFGFGQAEVASQVMAATVQWNMLLVVFNLIPIPPLDGSRVMTWILPPALRQGYASLERYGMMIILGLILFNVLGLIIRPVMGPLLELVDFLTLGVWQ